jgi:8-oxo-dGTP pyrophosphatase MutT (NUDIX family)
MSNLEQHANIKVESPGVNVAVLRNTDDGWRFLLLKRSEEETYSGSWGFVTGGKRGEETVAQVVAREVEEETSLIPESIWATEYVVQFYEPEVDAIWILPLLVAVVAPDSEVQLSSENSDFQWLSARKAKHLVTWKNLVKAIDDITDEIEIFPARNWVQIRP